MKLLEIRDNMMRGDVSELSRRTGISLSVLSQILGGNQKVSRKRQNLIIREFTSMVEESNNAKTRLMNATDAVPYVSVVRVKRKLPDGYIERIGAKTKIPKWRVRQIMRQSNLPTRVDEVKVWEACAEILEECAKQSRIVELINKINNYAI